MEHCVLFMFVSEILVLGNPSISCNCRYGLIYKCEQKNPRKIGHNVYSLFGVEFKKYFYYLFITVKHVLFHYKKSM